MKIGVAVCLGAITWSLLEYCIHRWAGHSRRWRQNLFATKHVRHHVEGDDFAPSWKKAAAAMVLFALVIGPAIFAGGLAGGLGYCGGFVGFYLFYEILHRRLHLSAGIGLYGRWARRHHFTDARFNHGVTSPIWDLVFGTHLTAEVITVPRRLMMPWLGDPETGVRPELAGTYVLKVKQAA